MEPAASMTIPAEVLKRAGAEKPRTVETFEALSRQVAFPYRLTMIFSESRYPLFGIMP
jgi:hypothetical protein